MRHAGAVRARRLAIGNQDAIVFCVPGNSHRIELFSLRSRFVPSVLNFIADRQFDYNSGIYR